LSIAQQLEAKAQTGHLSAIDAAAVPALAIAAGTLPPSGQMVDTNAGMSKLNVVSDF